MLKSSLPSALVHGLQDENKRKLCYGMAIAYHHQKICRQPLVSACISDFMASSTVGDKDNMCIAVDGRVHCGSLLLLQ